MSVYEGNKSYIFISYAHKDSKAVMKVIDELIARGYQVWYDEGIAPGSEWPENIAQHLTNSAAVIAFITPNSMASDNCRREIHFALSRRKPFLSVFLNKTDLTPGMELQLAAQQSVLRYNYRTEQEFIEKICSCEYLHPCWMSEEVSKPPVAQDTLVSNPQPKPDIRSRPAFLLKKKWLVCACAALIFAVALCYLIGKEKLNTKTGKTAVTFPTAAAAEVSVPSEVPSEAPSEAPSEPMPLFYMHKAETFNELKEAGYIGSLLRTSGFWGQQDYRREQVETVQFQSTQEGAPSSAWDISEAGDKSVLAWMDGTALHAAANGKITTADASYLFAYFHNLKTIDWGDCFDTSAVTDMSFMFIRCNALTSLDVSHFDTSAVANMYSMFYACSTLTSLDVSSFNTSAVTDMSGMFGWCNALTSLDLSHFDTSAVTNMSQMFENCSALTSLDVSGFNTSAVTNMSFMFYKCSALTSLDVSHFDTSAVTDNTYMFVGCSAAH